MSDDLGLEALGTEHIEGSVPASPRDAEAAKREFYSRLVSAVGDVSCIPGEKVHVFAPGGKRCLCGRSR